VNLEKTVKYQLLAKNANTKVSCRTVLAMSAFALFKSTRQTTTFMSGKKRING
jgi:hypothetical protein